MPIIESPHAGSSLSQGDILEGVTLFATKDCWTDSGGEAAKASHTMCLVLSRPCTITHKRHVIVAGIAKYPDNVPRDIETFEEVQSFLTDARDGTHSPDVFYLGQLPAKTGRFCARLDSIHTVEIPSDTAALQEFLRKKRVAALHPDFARDLHGRIFSSFSSLGFDDHVWLSDDDLKWLVEAGKADIAKVDATAQDLRAQKASRSAEGKKFDEGKLTEAEKLLLQLRKAAAPFEAEQTRRQGPTS